MKATEQYFPLVLFIMLYRVVLNFESVDEILKCNHLIERRHNVVAFSTSKNENKITLSKLQAATFSLVLSSL